MRKTFPKVYLVAQTCINHAAMLDYLLTVGQGADLWYNNIPSNDGDALTEFAGRLCYKSWKAGINPNVTRVRSDTGKYIANIIESEHGSVLEHTQVSFVFHDVSRVFTHELVRHRVGVAISQESLRYVRLVDVGFRIPTALQPLETEIVTLVERLEEFQVTAAQRLGLDDDDISFAYKKEVTSALRRLAPLGLSTSVLWSANLRTLRYVLGKRTEKAAEEEIRGVFDIVGNQIKMAYPVIFADFTRQDNGIWTSPHAKI